MLCPKNSPTFWTNKAKHGERERERERESVSGQMAAIKAADDHLHAPKQELKPRDRPTEKMT